MGFDYYLNPPKPKTYEELKSIIHNLIDEYNRKPEYYDTDSMWNLGAVEALEELLRRLGSEQT